MILESTHLDQVDLVLSAERLNELEVLGLRAGLDEDAEMRLALVQRLGALAKTARETVVNERRLQNLLDILSVILQSREYDWCSPEERPRRRACPWGPQRPRAQPRPRRP